MQERKAGMDPPTESPKPLTSRNKCSACFKQYKKKEHLLAHMRASHHSVHQPKCGVCKKHCQSFESLREHLTGPLCKAVCAKIFNLQGCNLCMDVFDSPEALNVHKETCWMSPAILLEHMQIHFAENSPKSGIGSLGLIEANHDDEAPKAIAMDCEMVGGGSDGTLDLCARVCLIDEDENMIFHSYVIPSIPITNYRYEITGITEVHLKDAMPLKLVREKIEEILHNGESIWKMRLQGGKARILVGHSIEHDLDCLEMNYPKHLQRDTAHYPPLTKTNLASHSLKYLTKTYLGYLCSPILEKILRGQVINGVTRAVQKRYEIQSGIHDPNEDCVAVMWLYKRMRGQSHQLAGHETTAMSSADFPTGLDDTWRQNELNKLSPDDLFAISKPNYRCWCLDLKAHTEY